MLRITTIGDGAMATVCSQILAGWDSGGNGQTEVTLWGRDKARLAEMAAARENRRYLPGVALAPALRFGADGQAAFHETELIVCAVPAQFIRPTLERLKNHIAPHIPVVSVAKGVELDTLKRPSEIILEILGPRPVAALSGPSIAGELARKLPATMVVAAAPAEQDFARRLQKLFTTPHLRIYRNDDLLGVELAGALKNVIGIAAGILDGMRAGNNAKAALLTRGLVEITRLGVSLGAKAETFTGLAGLGDLVTTCISPEGRNRTLGERLGRGEKLEAALASMPGVVEGVATCRAVVAWARARGIEMPISEGLHGVLFEGRDPMSQLADLMARESRRESAR